ncbi:MAG: ribonuclease-3 [Verrucomicrobiales bacterium]|jgi:ribonuclease-3
MVSLEQRINYKFRNSLLLAEALTHPSLAYETQKPHFDNQRLEFLGDAVIQLILTEELFSMFPTFSEGRLTKLRSRLVSRRALEEYAIEFELGEYLLMGRGEEASGGRKRSSTLADAFEALVGAIYLDGGISASRQFLLSHCRTAIEVVAAEPMEINPKGQLQEILQSISATSPKYRIVSQEGPDHCKTFESCVEWENLRLGYGSGPSKKEAEAVAAGDALRIRRWEDADALEQLANNANNNV